MAGQRHVGWGNTDTAQPLSGVVGLLSPRCARCSQSNPGSTTDCSAASGAGTGCNGHRLPCRKKTAAVSPTQVLRSRVRVLIPARQPSPKHLEPGSGGNEGERGYNSLFLGQQTSTKSRTPPKCKRNFFWNVSKIKNPRRAERHFPPFFQKSLHFCPTIFGFLLCQKVGTFFP